MTVPVALCALTKAGVSGFENERRGYLIYLGSFLWLCVLIGVDISFLITQNDDVARALVSYVMILNSIAFAAQTWDALCHHFFRWPLTAINWVCQLSAIAITGTYVSYSLSTNDDMRMTRIAFTVPRVIAQSVLTASQFAVTLEFLTRTSYIALNHKKKPCFSSP